MWLGTFIMHNPYELETTNKQDTKHNKVHLLCYSYLHIVHKIFINTPRGTK